MRGSEASHSHGRLQLLVATVTVVVIWLGVLPQLQRVPWFERRSRILREAGVETDAMFYTELNWDATNDRLPDPTPQLRTEAQNPPR